MSMTRRQALASPGAPAITSSLAKPAIAVNAPIRLGYLPALTGPSSSTGIGNNRGILLAVQEINAADRRDEPHARVKGERRPRPGQLRRVACGHAAARTRERAAAPSLLGRQS